MIIDGWIVSVGSTDFDNRWFRLNDEANLDLLDEKIATEQVQLLVRRPVALEGGHAHGLARPAMEGDPRASRAAAEEQL